MEAGLTMLARVLVLVLKELRTLLKDRRNRAVLLVPPILQTILFGYGANYDLEQIPVAIYDEDTSAVSRDLVAAFTGSPHFHNVVSITRDAEIAPLIDSSRVLAVIHISRTFTRDLLTGDSGHIQMILDGRNSNTASLTQRYAVDVIDGFFQDWEGHRQIVTPRFHVADRAWFNDNLRTRWYIIPAMLGLLTLVIVVLVTALSISRERELGTFEQILFTPLTALELFLGKLLPAVGIGFFEASVMLMVAVFWFHIPFRGSLIGLYIGIGLLTACGAGIGLMISSLSTTLQQSVISGFFFIIPAILLSGFVTPLANMTPALQWLAKGNPLTQFISLSRDAFLEGAGLGALSSQLAWLFAIALVLLPTAVIVFERRLYR
jgi:ABC-2 type transport system permease protein